VAEKTPNATPPSSTSPPKRVSRSSSAGCGQRLGWAQVDEGVEGGSAEGMLGQTNRRANRLGK
jgi:hypothetical protein